jgi:hypothetical protein
VIRVGLHVAAARSFFRSWYVFCYREEAQSGSVHIPDMDFVVGFPDGSGHGKKLHFFAPAEMLHYLTEDLTYRVSVSHDRGAVYSDLIMCESAGSHGFCYRNIRLDPSLDNDCFIKFAHKL